ncbi:PilC/PilY family type IV pilus protein, partial [uncultured Tolumonas sp.]|uniref:pilus assembly protein n=1 Tax=uncultured Tolumonas sp. TaxID=263765 RepID=UPI002A0A4543
MLITGAIVWPVSAAINIAQKPLFLESTMPPNVMFTLDNSGSMSWSFIPDSIGNDNGQCDPQSQRNSTITYSYSGSSYSFNANLCEANNYNGIYYDPRVTYKPRIDDDGVTEKPVSLLTDCNSVIATVTNCTYRGSSYNKPYSCRDSTYPVNNLSEAIQSSSYNSRTDLTDTTYAAPACYYFRYTPSGTPTKSTTTLDTTTSHYTFVAIDKSAPTKTYNSKSYDPTSQAQVTYRTDCANPEACTYSEELRNYSIWKQFYSTRIDAAKSYIGIAFSSLNSKIRVGYAELNNNNNDNDNDPTSIAGYSTSNIRLPVEQLSDSKNRFYTRLNSAIANNGTPLRSAMTSVGNYFDYSKNAAQIGTSASPWSDNPANLSNPGNISACRLSYNILMTDGYWNTDNPTATGPYANNDGVAGSAIGSYTYQPINPYKDNYSKTLADVAMYFWNKDLVDNNIAPNKVPKTSSDSDAIWQHLTQMTIGFGVSGKLNADNPSLSNSQILSGITNGTLTWPDPTLSDSAKLDDLWHAAVNSRGGFYNASNPTEFINALNAVLAEIQASAGSFSVTAANSSSITANSAIYQAGYYPGWVGRVFKYSLNQSTGAISATPIKASTPTPANRSIYTWGNTSSATTFTWDNLSAEQQGYLNINPKSNSGGTDTLGSSRLDYLRGVQSSEVQNNGTFRNRKIPADETGSPSAVLGDIINSSTVYVSNENYGYDDKVSALTTTEKTSYTTFNASTNKSSRTAMVYVGANDGMLHGFNADTLVEKFAVVPSAIYPKLNLLTSTDYAHEYYVDGSPVVGDAYINPSWKTVLLGSTGAGGKSVFALDITDPDHFATGKLMWQFDTSNPTYANNIGYSIPHPSIVRLHNGKFVALIANGYNSTNGHAVLFIVDIANGSVIKAIDADVGPDNGLSSPAPVDKDGDRITDYVYAGDLKGNLWKFDLSSDTEADWAATKLFTACSADTCSDSNRQPITSKPEAMRHPKGGIMVLFGTGSYFSTSDNAAARIEAIYGVRDYGSSELTRTNLLRQKILAEADDTRIVSNTAVDYSTYKGWYLPLIYPDTSTTPTGERVVNDMVLSSSKLIVTTLIPSAASSCDPGGNSWLMELDPINGARLNYVVLDINNDGALNDSDNKSYTETDAQTGVTKTNANTPVSGKKYSGLITTPTI